jgi:DNA repair exonuclease SbcCD nuclease subunit
MKILHISDFHTGSKSIGHDTPLPLKEEDFIFKTQEFIENEVDLPDLIIFTGDLVSVGNTSDLNNPEISEFFQPYVEKKIPILMCNGNHDLEEGFVRDGWQFIDYTSFILEHQNEFQVKVSKDFINNQASYIDFPKWNVLFLSLNSSPNIVKNSDPELKRASLGYKKTILFLDEVKEKIGFEFQHRNIFVIIHHPLEELIKHNDSIILLEKFNFRIIFAGDSHKFSVVPYKSHIGITAGSIFGSLEGRTDKLNMTTKPNQFNFYHLFPFDKRLQIIQYKNDLEKEEWIIGNTKSKNIIFRRKWSTEDFSNFLNINSQDLYKFSIQFLTDDLSKESDFLGFDLSGNKFLIYQLEKEDQKKVNFIQNIYKQIILKNQKFEKLIVIDKTYKLKCQIPHKYIIEGSK